MQPITSVRFLDVGQGTCNLIFLGNRKAIVIDCGGKMSFALTRTLAESVDEIEALVISHNDEDHAGGAANVVSMYPKRIRRLFFLHDRSHPKMRSLYEMVKNESNRGNLGRDAIFRLERKDDPETIFRDEEKGIYVEILYPTFLGNLAAEAECSPNATSGIIRLRCGRSVVILPGDATIREWKRLHQLHGRIECDILAVPHHGACESEVEYRWLFSNAISCRHAVISTGTSNQYSHPDPRCVMVLCSHGATVQCTQITPHCSDTLEILRPGVLPPVDPGNSRKNIDRAPRSGRSRNVACAGTVVADISPDTVAVRRITEHQTAVDRLSENGHHPLCRPVRV